MRKSEISTMNNITELRSKSQITIPKDIVKKLDLNQGDKLEIYVEDGKIYLVPVVVCPVSYVEGLKKEIEELKLRSNNK